MHFVTTRQTSKEGQVIPRRLYQRKKCGNLTNLLRVIQKPVIQNTGRWVMGLSKFPHPLNEESRSFGGPGAHPRVPVICRGRVLSPSPPLPPLPAPLPLLPSSWASSTSGWNKQYGGQPFPLWGEDTRSGRGGGMEIPT